MAEKPYGLAAIFDSAPAIYRAAKRVRDAGYKNWDVFTPFPVHGMDEAMGLSRSRVGAFVLVGGVVGFFTGMLLAWYMGAYDFPLIVSGMPYFSPIFPFPIAYELAILLGAFGAFFGMFITNLLPQHYHSIMNMDGWEQITDDAFALVIEAGDPNYDPEKTRALLEEIGAVKINEVEP